MQNIDIDTSSTLKTLLTLFLLTFFQMSCSYTPVYDSSGRPQAVPSETSGLPTVIDQESSNDNEPEAEDSEQVVRVAVVSPEAIKQRPTVSNKDLAAAKLRTQASEATADGEAAKAERLLNRALRISPRSPETYHQLASLKFEQGASGQALQLARKGLSVCDPDSPLADQLQALAAQAGALD